MECRDQVTHVEDFNLPSGDLLQFAMDNGHWWINHDFVKSYMLNNESVKNVKRKKGYQFLPNTNDCRVLISGFGSGTSLFNTVCRA